MFRLLHARHVFFATSMRFASTQAAPTARASEFFAHIQKFNTLLANADKTTFEKAQEATQWFEKLKDAKFHINLETYTKLVQVLATDRRLNGCLKIYNFMKKSGVKPNEQMIQIMLMACARAKKSTTQNDEHFVEHAKKLLFQDRVKWKIDSNIVMYNEFMKTCSTMNDVQSAYETFRKLVDTERIQAKKPQRKQREVKIVEDEEGNQSVVPDEDAEKEEREWIDKVPHPDEFTFTIMVQLLARNMNSVVPGLGKITMETCFAIIDEMNKFPKLQKDAHVYASLMKAVMMQDAEHPQMVIELYKQLIQHTKPTAHIMMIVLSAAKRMTPRDSSNTEMILNVYKEIKAQKVIGDADLLNHMCCTLAQYGHYNEALAMFKQDFHQRMLAIHPVTFHTLLHHGFKHYSKNDAGQAMAWFEQHIQSILFKMLEQQSPVAVDRVISNMLKHRRLLQFIYPFLQFVSAHKLPIQYGDDRRVLSLQTTKELHEKMAERPNYEQIANLIKE